MRSRNVGGSQPPGGSVGQKEKVTVPETGSLSKTKVVVDLVGIPVTDKMVDGIERIAANLSHLPNTRDTVGELHAMHDERAAQLDRAVTGDWLRRS